MARQRSLERQGMPCQPMVGGTRKVAPPNAKAYACHIGLALLLGIHAFSGALVAGQGTTTDGIDLQEQRDAGLVDTLQRDCEDNIEVYDLLNFLSGSSDVGPSNASSELDLFWSISDLCSLSGVGCLPECDDQVEKNLLDPLCTVSNTTLGDLSSSELAQKMGNKFNSSGNVAMALISYCVVDMNLANRGLQGDLSTLSGLTNLRTLNVSQNNVTGNMIDLDKMKELVRLDVSSNLITGDFAGLANPELREFHGNNNDFFGDLSGLQKAPNLTYLDVRSNRIVGTINPLTSLPFLQYAYLNENQLIGNINAIQDMDNLLMFSASNNSLSGALPDEKNMTTLAVLMLRNNFFTTAGAALSKMRNLQFADLSRNKITDNVNALMESATYWLGALDLNDNDLDGVIETDILDGVPNLEILFIAENPKLRGRLIPDLANYQQIQVSTVDQFLYYVVDRDVFASIETVSSKYFKIQHAYLATDINCTNFFSDVHDNNTIQDITVPQGMPYLYYCFTLPRGKFLIDENTRSIVPFNKSYFASVDSCGISANQQSGEIKAGHLFLEERIQSVALPVSTCDDPNSAEDKISMTLYMHGDYGDVSRGYIQNTQFQVEVRETPATSLANFTPYIILIALIVVIAIILSILIGIAISTYVAFQKQLAYKKMKKNAESAFVKTRKHSRISKDKDACVVFTDIQSSTMLRDASSQRYHEIILVHDGAVRKLIAKLGGLELATEGDGFVLWFESVAHATVFCMELQQELMHVSWSPSIKKLCNKVYSQQKSPTNMMISRASNHSSNTSERALPFYTKVEKRYTNFLLRLGREEKLFNGPRVRCGVHVVRSELNTVENISLGLYSFSGPDFEKGRSICDMGHGGQVLVSAEAQQVILENLNATQFPQIWHWGGYTFDSEDNAEVHHIYEVAPSQGMIRRRNFEGLRGHVQLAYPPGVRFSSRNPPTEDAIIVCATVKDSNVTPKAIEIAENLLASMQQRFWGWPIAVEDLSEQSTKFVERRSVSFLGRDSMRGASSKPIPFLGRDSMRGTRTKQVSQKSGKKWYFAFAKPEDALRFALCCQLELVYADWPKKIRSRYKKLLTADKAPLWNGLPVAFAVHICKSPSFEMRKSVELVSTQSIRMRTPSKSNLELCNPSAKSFLHSTADKLRETISILDNVALDGQVVVTSGLIQSMTVPVSNIGDPVVEHLGKIEVAHFSDPVDVYQVLPVELAAREFPSLSETLQKGKFLACGARSAPTPKIGLTFVFVYTISKDAESPAAGEGAEMFSSDSIFDDEYLQILLTKYNGYLVDEVSLSNMVFAFDSLTSAVCFCTTIQRSLAICKSRLCEDCGSFEMSDAAPADEVDAVNLLRVNHQHNKHLKIGIASIESHRQVLDVFEGIDSNTGRRRYGTPVLNLASRVAKSARVGQILLVARNHGINLWTGRVSSNFDEIGDNINLIERGYFKVRGFGDKPTFVYEVRSGDPVVACLDLESDIVNTDYMMSMAAMCVESGGDTLEKTRSLQSRSRSRFNSSKSNMSTGRNHASAFFSTIRGAGKAHHHHNDHSTRN